MFYPLCYNIESDFRPAVSGKCSVTLYNDVEPLTNYLKREDAFYYKLIYDPSLKTLQEDRGSMRIGSDHQSEIQSFLKDRKFHKFRNFEFCSLANILLGAAPFQIMCLQFKFIAVDCSIVVRLYIPLCIMWLHMVLHFKDYGWVSVSPTSIMNFTSHMNHGSCSLTLSLTGLASSSHCTQSIRGLTQNIDSGTLSSISLSLLFAWFLTETISSPRQTWIIFLFFIFCFNCLISTTNVCVCIHQSVAFSRPSLLDFFNWSFHFVVENSVPFFQPLFLFKIINL